MTSWSRICWLRWSISFSLTSRASVLFNCSFSAVRLWQRTSACVNLSCVDRRSCTSQHLLCSVHKYHRQLFTLAISPFCSQDDHSPATAKFPDIFSNSLQHLRRCCVNHFKHVFRSVLPAHYDVIAKYSNKQKIPQNGMPTKHWHRTKLEVMKGLFSPTRFSPTFPWHLG